MAVFDVLNPDLYAAGDPATNGMPLDQFERLRHESPVFRQAINDPLLVDWAWAITRYDDVVACARDHHRLVSGRGVTLRHFEPTLEESGGKPTMITMDGDRHVRNRRIVSRGFSPNVIRQVRERFRQICTRTLDAALAKGSVDFVEDVAVWLPLHAICDLMGVPDADRDDVLRWTNTFSVPTDPDFAPTMEESMAAVMAICDYGVRLAEMRRQDPREDAMSKVAAALETEHLTESELMGMVLLLAGAGNETTRNALSHGMHALMRNPEQMDLLRNDTDGVIDTAVEEVLRWSSPLIQIRRTAAEDMEIAGTQIAAGDPVALFFSSANFDETVFPEPQRFDLTRTPNQHVAFGTGPHVCLGAAVARLEIEVMLRELVARTSRIEQLGPIEYARDSFLRGVKRLPVRLVAA